MKITYGLVIIDSDKIISKTPTITGLFRSVKLTFFNADVNATYNSIRKVNSSAFDHLIRAKGVMDAGLHPQCLELYAFILPK